MEMIDELTSVSKLHKGFWFFNSFTWIFNPSIHYMEYKQYFTFFFTPAYNVLKEQKITSKEKSSQIFIMILFNTSFTLQRFTISF